jgi:hypothetical protein
MQRIVNGAKGGLKRSGRMLNIGRIALARRRWWILEKTTRPLRGNPFSSCRVHLAILGSCIEQEPTLVNNRFRERNSRTVPE